ncbi:hypothetical protein COOONC_25942, partial [Cooperia oncophora]
LKYFLFEGICCEFLKKNLGPVELPRSSSDCRFSFLSGAFRCTDMYIIQNFQKVAESENFNLLSFNRLAKLISSEEWNLRSEEKVCDLREEEQT